LPAAKGDFIFHNLDKKLDMSTQHLTIDTQKSGLVYNLPAGKIKIKRISAPSLDDLDVMLKFPEPVCEFMPDILVTQDHKRSIVYPELEFNNYSDNGIYVDLSYRDGRHTTLNLTYEVIE
jgi:hypothetical protein